MLASLCWGSSRHRRWNCVGDIIYGAHVRNWFAPWHQPETPPPDPHVPEVWRFLFSAAATTDKYLRMYHVVLTNPEPAKLVRTLAIESLKQPSGLMIAGMSVGPLAAERQMDTIPPLKNPFPDLRPRSGEKVSGAGVVKRITGEPLAGVRVRVMKVRAFAESYNQGTEHDEAVGLEAVTGADGSFTLPPMRDDRVYNLLATADGYETAPFGGADVKSDPIELRLKPQTETATFTVRGKVLGNAGLPLALALIEPQTVETAPGSTTSSRSGFQEQIFSDSAGEFVFTRTEPFVRLQVRVKSPGFAPAMAWLEVSKLVHTIRLGAGVAIRGRVVNGTAPMTNVGVGVSGVDRSFDVYAGHFETRTDTHGVFVFTNLPAGNAWYAYGIMATLGEDGALPPQLVNSGVDGEIKDLGDLAVQRGLRLAGKVETRYGEPLPAGVTIRVGYDKVWGSQMAGVDENGRFEFNGLFSGPLSLSLEPRSWRLSGANRSLDLLNGWRMAGLLESDKANLLLVIEKGEYNYNSGGAVNGQLPMQDRPENNPLLGAEKTGPPPIVLAGRVIDDKTGQSITRYKVVPGYKPPVNTIAPPPGQKPLLKTILQPFVGQSVPWNEQPFWMHGRTETMTQAGFAVEFVPLSSSPMLRFEADDYLPFESEPYANTTSNLVVRLRAGTGPNGVVLLPDGKPAEGATVVFAITREQFTLGEREFKSRSSEKSSQTTGKDGKFSFPMRAQGRRVFVTHNDGWAEASVEQRGENLKLRLQRWATLLGTLVDTNGRPMAGVELAVTMQNDWPRGEPLVNSQGRVVTDAQGNFRFVDVPPRRLEVQRVIPFISTGGQAVHRGWTYQMQTWLIAQPGTNNLGNVTYDQPPPAPLVEQIKKSIGL
jgi:protocatechuate 3,4-dioxygenase beta subunit